MISEQMCRKYCKDSIDAIENYAIAKNSKERWDCHHRLETHNSDGEKRLVQITKEELIFLDCFYNRPATELIFIKASEHTKLHKVGGHITEAHKIAISKANRENAKTRCNADMRNKLSEARKQFKGEKNPFYNKKHTDETRKRLSENHKGICKGKHWYNNGQDEVMDYTCPQGYIKGRLHKQGV